MFYDRAAPAPLYSESPLGKELIGKKTGDRIKLQTRGPAQEFRILSVR